LRIDDEKRRILIINLTRMGDLLQMTPFLKAFREENPDVEVTLFVLKQFEEVCAGFPFVDRVQSFDAKDFLSKLSKPDRSLVEDYQALKRVFEGLRQQRFDSIINLSFSNHSALLTRLLRAPDVRGITIDDEGNRRLRHPWINHFYNMVDNREINPFNFVDFIRKIGGVIRRSPMTFVISQEAQDFARAFYRDRGVPEGDCVVGLQPGASSENKRWPAESFGSLATRLIQKGIKVVLFGSSREKGLGERVRKAMSIPSERVDRYLLNVIGETTVEQLAAFLARVDLLVTNDTGTMHVATSVGTRVVELSLGPVYFRETGPYGEGHLVVQTGIPCAPCGFHVQCKNPKCRDSISVTQVFKVVEMARNGELGDTRQLEDDSDWDGIQLYRSSFDEDGMLEFLPLIRRPLERIDLMKLIYREMWKILLDKRPDQVDSNRVCQKIHGVFHVNGSALNLEEDHRVFETLADLARQGVEISKRLVRWSEDPGDNISAIKTAGQIIHTLDEQIELQGLTHRACHPLAFMFRQGKENLDEGNIASLSRETLELYKTLLHEANLMNQGLRQTVASLERNV
jgi:ADP-heptose:LPS heptosyltransferase